MRGKLHFNTGQMTGVVLVNQPAQHFGVAGNPSESGRAGMSSDAAIDLEATATEAEPLEGIRHWLYGESCPAQLLLQIQRIAETNAIMRSDVDEDSLP